MQMRRCFIHVKMSREYPKIRISFFKIVHIPIKYLFCQFTVFGFSAHGIFITYLKYDLMERFFLFACSDFFIVIGNHSVASGLFFVVLLKSFIKQFMIYVLNFFIAVCDVIFRSFTINIFCNKISIVMGNRAFSDHCTDRSFHKISPLFGLFRFCYSCQE